MIRMGKGKRIESSPIEACGCLGSRSTSKSSAGELLAGINEPTLFLT